MRTAAPHLTVGLPPLCRGLSRGTAAERGCRAVSAARPCAKARHELALLHERRKRGHLCWTVLARYFVRLGVCLKIRSDLQLNQQRLMSVSK